MRYVAMEDWSRRDSPIHRRDPRVKLAALLAVIIAAGTADDIFSAVIPGLLVLAGVYISRIPAVGFLIRLLTILPVPGVFALIAALAGDPGRAVLLLVRSAVSIAAMLLTVSTTPLPHILAALSWFRVPPMLVEVLQFLYRYLFVLAEEVFIIRAAAAARSGSTSLLAAAAGVSVLFARSYARAEAIHRSLLARGFAGRLTPVQRPRLNAADALLMAIVLGVVVLTPAALRIL